MTKCYCVSQEFRFFVMLPVVAALRAAPGTQSGCQTERDVVSLRRERDPEEVVPPPPAQDCLPATPAPMAFPPCWQALFLVGEPQHWLFLGREGSPDVDCSRGQIRPLLQDILKQKRKEFALQPPLNPLQALSGVLWDGYILRCCAL